MDILYRKIGIKREFSRFCTNINYHLICFEKKITYLKAKNCTISSFIKYVYMFFLKKSYARIYIYNQSDKGIKVIKPFNSSGR